MTLSERYINDRFLPDKAIDLIWMKQQLRKAAAGLQDPESAGGVEEPEQRNWKNGRKPLFVEE